MKVRIEKLGLEVDAPDGLVVVHDGNVRESDLVWHLEEGKPGWWSQPSIYGVGTPAHTYWCVLRAWVDEGAGI